MATLTVWKFDTPTAPTRRPRSSWTWPVRAWSRSTTPRPSSGRRARRSRGPTSSPAPPGPGALGGGFWGLLFGLIFFVPLLGAAIGAATGALAGSLSDVGIDDEFINKVRDQVTPGTSALFVMTSDAVLDKIQEALRRDGPGELIFTDLDSEQEAALREVFAQS